MPSTTNYRRGDVVLVFFPFTDLTSSKRRPALVISPDSFNVLRGDLVLAAITSHLTEDADAIRLQPSDFIDGQLPRTSIVKIAKLFTIHSSLVVKKACGLRREKTEQVLETVRHFFS